jgi:V-type H+-transporting ATPase subunit G
LLSRLFIANLDSILTLSQHTSGNKKAEEDANKDAETQMKTIKEAGKKGQDKVVTDLLKAVFDVKPQVPDRIEMPS